MATTTNYGWTTPDNTDLVKDGAAAIRTLGSSIDTTLKTQIDAQIPDSLLTTKGDLIVATGASTPARLASSATNDHALLVDTSTATGLKWAAVPSAATSYTLLNAGGTALTGAATITVSGISNQDKLLIIIEGGSSSNATANYSIRLNGDSASNYYAYGFRIDRISSNPNFDPITGAATEFVVGVQGAAANVLGCGVSVFGGKSSGMKMVDIKGAPSASTGSFAYNTTGYYNSSSTISSVSAIVSAGNWDAGTLYVYGSAN